MANPIKMNAYTRVVYNNNVRVIEYVRVVDAIWRYILFFYFSCRQSKITMDETPWRGALKDMIFSCNISVHWALLLLLFFEYGEGMPAWLENIYIH